MTKTQKFNINLFLSPVYWVGLLAIAILVIFISVLFYSQKRMDDELFYKKTQENYVLELNQEIDSIFRNVISDVRILSKYRELNRFLADGNSESLSDFSQELLDFARLKGVYDQVRFIDENGKEVVRINYNNGRPEIVDKDKLQDKSKRYYFRDAFALNEGEVFVSPFDLNIENSKIEQPIKPMIRVAMPIFYNGEKRGVMVLNYLGEKMLSSLDHTIESGIEVNFLNQDGYWLFSTSGKNDWAFMYDDKLDLKLPSINPSVWEVVSSYKNKQFFDEGNLYTSETITPYVLAQSASSGSNKAYSPSLTFLDPLSYKWILYTVVPKSVLYKDSNNTLIVLLIIDSIFIVMVFTITRLLYKASKQRYEAEKDISNLNEILQVINKILRHDLANTFTAIKANLDLYAEDKSEEILNNVQGAIASGIRLINKMKQLESAMRHKDNKAELAVEEVVRQATKDMPVSVEVEGKAVVRADQALEVVFANLVSNAIRHGKAKNIKVEITNSPDEVRISVADDGTGISRDIKDKIFNEGFKSGMTGNTGLGLYIVQKTIQRYGGSISVVDNQPQGAKFVILLPK